MFCSCHISSSVYSAGDDFRNLIILHFRNLIILRPPGDPMCQPGGERTEVLTPPACTETKAKTLEEVWRGSSCKGFTAKISCFMSVLVDFTKCPCFCSFNLLIAVHYL